MEFVKPYFDEKNGIRLNKLDAKYELDRMRWEPGYWCAPTTYHPWGTVEGMFQPYRPQDRDMPQPTEWIVEDFIALGQLIVLGGSSKIGKSCFATALALAVVTGEPFLGLKTKLCSVLWLAQEESREERLEVLGKWPGNSKYEQVHLYTCYERVPIDDDMAMKCLQWWFNKVRPSLIVIDPLYASTNAQSLSDGTAARRALSGLKDFCRHNRVTIIVLHHFNKSTTHGMVRERLADSNQIPATASMDILMESRTVGEVREPSHRGGGQGEGFGAPSRFPDLLGADKAQTNHEGTGEDRLIPQSPKATQPLTPEEIEANAEWSPSDLLPIGVWQRTTQEERDAYDETGILSPRVGYTPTPPTIRQIRLICTGRGRHSNQTWLIESPAELEFNLITRSYGLIDFPRGLADRIVACLAKEPATAADLATTLNANLQCLRNELTALRTLGKIEILAKKGKTPIYQLVDVHS